MKFLASSKWVKVVALSSAFAVIIGGGSVFAGKEKVKKVASAKSVQQQSYIGEEAAKAKAIEIAKATGVDPSKVLVKLERDDDSMEYDVNFTYNGYKYDIDIDAVTGEKMEYSKKLIKKANAEVDKTKPVAGTYIGAQEAKAIALKKIAVSADKVVGLKSEFDKERGIYKYEVEFDYNGYEYDFDIDAKTGAIISWNKEVDEDAYNYTSKQNAKKSSYGYDNDDDDDDDDDDDNDDDDNDDDGDDD